MARRAPTFCGISEVADYYGVSKQLVYKWTKRSDFPDPIAGPDHPDNPLSMGQLWRFADVKDWGKRHKRRKGAGPREATAGSAAWG